MKLMSTKSNDVTLNVQWLYMLLYVCSVFCALWHLGEPELMGAVMIAAPFMVLLSRIPKRIFNPFMRQLAQIAVGAMAFVWVKIRLMEIEMDILVFEGMAVLALSLFIGRRLREYGFLLFCCCCMLGYGGLRPARDGFLPIFFLSLCLVVFIMYLTRTSLLVSMKTRERGVTLPRIRGGMVNYLLHFTAAFVLMIVLIYVLPFKKILRGRGFIPVSFDTERELLFDRFWEQFGPQNRQSGQDGREETDSNDPQMPPDYSPSAKEAADIDNAPSFDSQGGGGAAPTIGKDLVFRAYTPGKLYWVVQMYDTYDGKKWTQSDMMKSGRCLVDRIRAPRGTLVPQRIVLEKHQGALLPYAYRFEHGRFRDNGNNNQHAVLLNLHDNVKLGIRALEKPELPWSYFVMSYVPSLHKETISDPLNLLSSSSPNYRSLPNVISERTYRLAKEITEGAADPYEKACRIRDHLRNTYKYDLQCPPVPPDGEVVDFFLFESKKGYCQHFAQAFAVLARAAGLHSRLVTGYSPGNYNLLANCFEVYEYHAHAWVQIFIKQYGWLTFDGVAPGNLNIENTPKALNSLIDPFGSEWDAQPPEFSIVPPNRRNNRQIFQHRDSRGNNRITFTRGRGESLVDRIFRRAVRDNHAQNPDFVELTQATLKEVYFSARNALAKVVDPLRQWLGRLWDKIRLAFTEASLAVYLVCGAIFVMLCVLFAFRRKIIKAISFHWRLHRAMSQWKQQTRRGASARQTVIACQRLASSLLDLAQFQHALSDDLLERAEKLKETAPGVAAEYQVVAVAAAEATFAPGFPDKATASRTLAATQRFLRIIQPYLKRK